MQRNGMERRRETRRDAERDAAQPIGGQPRPGDDPDELEKPDAVPSFLTARELQARAPARGQEGEGTEGRREEKARKGKRAGLPPARK